MLQRLAQVLVTSRGPVPQAPVLKSLLVSQVILNQFDDLSRKLCNACVSAVAVVHSQCVDGRQQFDVGYEICENRKSVDLDR